VFGPIVNNLSGVTQVIQCEVRGDKEYFDPTYLAVRVNPGWATTSSCNLAYESPDGGVWVIWPSSINHPNGSRDEVLWSAGFNPAMSAVVQCWLPPNAQMRDYYVETYLHIYNFTY
jgi:hypothetical protein